MGQYNYNLIIIHPEHPILISSLHQSSFLNDSLLITKGQLACMMLVWWPDWTSLFVDVSFSTSQVALILSPASWLLSVTSSDAFVQWPLGCHSHRLQIDSWASYMQSELMKLHGPFSHITKGSALCSPVPMFPNLCSPNLCSPVPMFPDFYTLIVD